MSTFRPYPTLKCHVPSSGESVFLIRIAHSLGFDWTNSTLPPWTLKYHDLSYIMFVIKLDLPKILINRSNHYLVTSGSEGSDGTEKCRSFLRRTSSTVQYLTFPRLFGKCAVNTTSDPCWGLCRFSELSPFSYLTSGSPSSHLP